MLGFDQLLRVAEQGPGHTQIEVGGRGPQQPEHQHAEDHAGEEFMLEVGPHVLPSIRIHRDPVGPGDTPAHKEDAILVEGGRLGAGLPRPVGIRQNRVQQPPFLQVGRQIAQAPLAGLAQQEEPRPAAFLAQEEARELRIRQRERDR